MLEDGLSGTHSCNSEVVTPTSTSEHVDPETGVRYTLASVEITRDQVEEYFGEYHCSCAADSGKGNRLSRRASVGYACEYSCNLARSCQ